MGKSTDLLKVRCCLRRAPKHQMGRLQSVCASTRSRIPPRQSGAVLQARLRIGRSEQSLAVGRGARSGRVGVIANKMCQTPVDNTAPICVQT